MNVLNIKLNKQAVSIEKSVFEALLDIAYLKESTLYIKAIESGELTFEMLKKLANKAGVPYPLFLAPRDVVTAQLKEKDRHLYEKIPTKHELRLSTRGRVDISDIELIARDLGRKQEFLKRRVLPTHPDNEFIGCLGKKVKLKASIEELASDIRAYLDMDLSHLRKLTKEKVLRYISELAEAKGILVSFSSHNYMPQNLVKELELSGFCVRDKKFPYIFINTRDGDESPKILESDGRQIFTLLSMLACIAMGKFILSSKTGSTKENPTKLAFAIAGEIIIPSSDLSELTVSTLDELKSVAKHFKVTPSMLLFRLRESKKISVTLARDFKAALAAELKKKETIKGRAPLPVTAYGKYNGQRLSREIIGAYKTGTISQLEMKNILFRRGRKMDPSIINQYFNLYR